jgi:hydroxyethylthiazole kinase-like uncharacterized protein yjeF
MTDSNLDADYLPRALYRADQVRDIDRCLIQTLGIPSFDLMRNAGLAAFRALQQAWADARVLRVVCGAGNNAGDGYILAQAAREAGLDVRAHTLVPASQLKGDGLFACQAFQAAGGHIAPYSEGVLEDADVVVDALFGTGLDREVTGRYAEAIGAINRFGGGVLALDIPSGLNADTGCPMGIAVRADVTVTFIGLKQGLFTGQGLEYCGKIVFADLNVPRSALQAFAPSAMLLRSQESRLPPRPRAAHKGDFGHALVVGGDHGFTGAARLAAEAAARVGAGLVSVATRSAHAGIMNLTRPELMCHGVERTDDLKSLMQRATVLAIGPGLGQSEWAQALFEAAYQSPLPLVVDADALNLLARAPRKRENWILTPHPGEAARLLQTSSSEIQRDRYAAVRDLQGNFGGIVVLKGSGTLIRGSDDIAWVCPAGNPGMASGGMGDVLTGIITGLAAQKLSLLEAGKRGVCLHGTVGDRAARDGERGLLASDLLPLLRAYVNQ